MAWFTPLTDHFVCGMILQVPLNSHEVWFDFSGVGLTLEWFGRNVRVL